MLFSTASVQGLFNHSWRLRILSTKLSLTATEILMSHYYLYFLYFFPSYILIQETTYVLSSTLHPNLANQICGQAEVVICVQALACLMFIDGHAIILRIRSGDSHYIEDTAMHCFICVFSRLAEMWRIPRNRAAAPLLITHWVKVVNYQDGFVCRPPIRAQFETN